MFKQLRRIALLIPLLAGLAACKPGADNPSAESHLEPRTPQVSANSDRVFVAIFASGRWTVELEYPEEGPAGWAWMEPESGTGDCENARLRFDKNTSADSRSVTLLLKIKGKVAASAWVEQLGTDGASSIEGDFSKAGWLELPAIPEDDRRVFLAHDMKGKEYLGPGSGMRNWSCLWDYNEHMSVWVAYPLNTSLHGKGNFDYLWGFDPQLPQRIQPDLTGGSYGGKGFDGKNNWNRGHQLPRADRQVSEEAVASTCYPTNITPQDGSFNSGIWGRLESKVRTYASYSDTTYVVTGCTWDASGTYTKNYTGFAVKVPDHYFKAILYYGPHSQASATGHYMAAAFYLPHDSDISGDNYLNYIMTVDELEERTGIDFFVNLPAAVGQAVADKIESQLLNFWK